MFRISKIQFFESNSQQELNRQYIGIGCSEYQRYNFLKAIHNLSIFVTSILIVVQNIKDTIFWKQFTTCHNLPVNRALLFRISKIQFFESNSQRIKTSARYDDCCSEYQRYNFLKAIHNFLNTYHIVLRVVQNIKDTIFWKQFTTIYDLLIFFCELFRISKIQFFESNSQPDITSPALSPVVQNIKDTIFWKQFTTILNFYISHTQLFRISKIQFFESNSQLHQGQSRLVFCCSEYQRYNFLKAIHNYASIHNTGGTVVQNIKDTIFWKQFTTIQNNFSFRN